MSVRKPPIKSQNKEKILAGKKMTEYEVNIKEGSKTKLRWLLNLSVLAVSYLVCGLTGIIVALGCVVMVGVVIAAWERSGSYQDRHGADSNDSEGG